MTITGILYIGDIIPSPIIYRPDVATAFALLDQDDPLTNAPAIPAGYHYSDPVLEEGIQIFFHLITIQLIMSETLNAAQRNLAPDN